MADQTVETTNQRLSVRIPAVCPGEIEYVLSVVLEEWLGIPYTVETHASDNVEISHNHRRLTLDTSFFQRANIDWLGELTMPVLPLRELRLAAVPEKIARSLRECIPNQPDVIPVLYGNPKITVQDANDVPSGGEHYSRQIHCSVDILGSAFFMLSRYEEAILPDRDQHDRFPATASIAYRAGFLDRPVVNEYVELLWAMMSHLWPGLERKPRTFRVLVSHDVDSPFEYVGLSAKAIIRRMGGDILKRRSPSRAMNTFGSWHAANRGDVSKDPHNTFDFIMEESEKRGLTSAFYFIPDHSAGAIDGRYSLDEPKVAKLLRDIFEREHEIGLHTSYNTYLDAGQTSREADLLRQALIRHGVGSQPSGGRQHFLRWSTPETFRNWERAGMEYDTTLGFADHAGFRCGTCWEYPTYDVVQREPLLLRERPLVAMEVSVINEQYMGLGCSDQALSVLTSLKDTCRTYNGDFTFLWHNSNFPSPESREIYTAALDH